MKPEADPSWLCDRWCRFWSSFMRLCV